jgi:hypothetical protein
MPGFIKLHHPYLLTAAVVAITIAGVLLVVNFMGGEKKIQHRIERLYSLEDPRFTHELGVLLGPPFIGGNRHQVLLNGEQIFPPMLAAIRRNPSRLRPTSTGRATLALSLRMRWSSGHARASRCMCCWIGWAAQRWMKNLSMT